ncbi:hypothetical protein FQN52_008079 [Onygenales sp. PD_12]|nr:hypothetical protein FQN52_008079 [Onygenales sp. PD_12]
MYESLLTRNTVPKVSDVIVQSRSVISAKMAASPASMLNGGSEHEGPSTRDNTFDRLSRRLELLEQQVVATPTEPPATPAPAGKPTETTQKQTPTHDDDFGTRDAGSETLIYQLVNEAKDTTLGTLACQDSLTPENAPSNMNNAITALNSALEELGNLTVSSNEESLPEPRDLFTRDEARQCVGDAFDYPPCSPFIYGVDRDFMKAMPETIDSSLVQIDPAVRLLYFNLLFHGQNMGQRKSSTVANSVYVKCLQEVSAWQKSAKGTIMDIIAASVTAWTAISAFDYHLGWKFHRVACRFATNLNLLPIGSQKTQQMDVPTKGLIMGMAHTDIMFRLFYDKPYAIHNSTIREMDLPSLMSPASAPRSSQPRAAPTITYILWVRLAYITSDFFEYLDNHSNDRTQRPEDFRRKIFFFCDQIEELMEDWPIAIMMKTSTKDPMAMWILADVRVAAYTTIILMERKLYGDEYSTVSPRMLRAARIVLDSIFQFASLDSDTSGKLSSAATSEEESQRRRRRNSTPLIANAMRSLISFYPFSAFFSLYYHIIACPDPENCKEDISALERLGAILRSAACVQTEFVPISNAINALNQVSRVIQEQRRTIARAPCLQGTPLQVPDMPSSHGQRPAFAKRPQQQAGAGYTTPPSPNPNPMTTSAETPQIQFPAPPEDLFSSMEIPMLPDASMIEFEDGFEPMEYMRAVENEFIGRNWHESWWNFD